jgi:hypothetical protein
MTMAVGIAADHGGFALKAELASLLRGAGFRVSDFRCIDAPPPDDDYPDLIVPLARVVVAGEVETRRLRFAAAAWGRVRGCEQACWRARRFVHGYVFRTPGCRG